LIRATRLEVAQALIFEVRAFIVNCADPQIEFDELLFHKLSSTTPCWSAFLLLIRISIEYVNRMILAGRNSVGLTEREIERCLWAWKLLCGAKERTLIVSEATKHSSRTYFDQSRNVVYLGADVKPGVGIEANARMSILACLAHELSHAERYELGFDRPIDFPELLIDEAETSLHASYISILNPKDREDLIEDARDRLNQWFVEISAGKARS
jgi:hypothetical protein